MMNIPYENRASYYTALERAQTKNKTTYSPNGSSKNI